MGQLKIHSQNILPIIKQWLYSDKDIFVRELVSNASDAIHKRKVLDEGAESHRIDIAIDKEARTLTFTDTGLGMSAEEVEKYIAEVAFSGAEEFVEKYQKEEEAEQIIGHFGLGFFSSFMVADKVEIQTKSYSDAPAAHWVCEGSADYSLEEGSREETGTAVILHINKESDEYLDPAHIRSILMQHCAFLPIPIFLGDAQINKEDPLFVKPASECTEKEYIDFYRQLYPTEPEPLFWVHLNVDFPFHLKGILYFPRIGRDFSFEKNSLKLFCNRVFVSDNCKDLIPEYLTALRGAIDSPDIPLNVSRSALQMDRTVRQLAGHISKKVSDRLVSLFKTDNERYLKCWEDLQLIIKLGAIQDDKFYERVKEAIIFKNTNDEWTSVEDYLERCKDKHANKVFYTQAHGCLDLYKEKGIEVLYTHGPIDTHLLSFLETKLTGVQFQRIDGAIDDVILDKEKEKTLLDDEGKTQATRLAQFVKTTLGVEELEVEAKSLASSSLPAFMMIDEQSRRMREFMAMSSNNPFEGKKTLVVNTNNKLMETIEALHGKSPELAHNLLRQVYDQALLSQRELKPEDLDAYLSRSNQVLEEIANLLV